MVDLRTTARTSAGPSGNKRNKGVSQSEQIAKIEERVTHLASSADLEKVNRKVTKITLEVAKINEKTSHLASSADLERVRHEVIKGDEKISKDVEKVRHEVTNVKVWVLVGILGGMAFFSGVIISVVGLFFG